MELNQAKINLQLTTQKGLHIIIGGIIFWIIASISGMLLPKSIVIWVYLIGIGSIFPLGIVIAKILKIDIFAIENPLGRLASIIGGINLLNIPLVLIIYFNQPSWLPFIVGITAGAHFLPYIWIYDSKAYGFLSVFTVLASSICGFLFMSKIFIILPISLSVVYFITVLLIIKENNPLSKA